MGDNVVFKNYFDNVGVYLFSEYLLVIIRLTVITPDQSIDSFDCGVDFLFTQYIESRG